MLIVSKFHDYYDVGMKLGMDKTVVYKRDTVAVEKTFPSITVSQFGAWNTGVIAFCGKFYPFVYHCIDSKISKVIWDAEEAVSKLPKRKSRFFWDEDNIDSELGIRRFFDRKYPSMESLFVKNNVPIFGFKPGAIRSYSWKKNKDFESLVLNPNLKNIQFYKVKDPITTFQEINMYLSGVLGSRSPEPLPISDKLKAQAHGHDDKYSFKKPPGEKKRRKK